MSKPKALILSGYGLNCEDETKFAFETAGATADIVHINDLVTAPKRMSQYQIMAVPGGFSYGDDTGSGKAYANKLKNHLSDQLHTFANSDKLIIGICNGFQILTQAGLLPGALTTNKNGRYLDRWVDLTSTTSRVPSRNFSGLYLKNIRDPETRKNWIPDSSSDALRTSGMTHLVSPWLTNISSLSLPIAHGEGNYYIESTELKKMYQTNAIALVYADGEICQLQNLESNPNGALEDIAAITANNGRILGMMPHPERAMFFTQLPHWTLLKEKLIRADQELPEYGPGLQIFKNAVNYFN